MSSGEAGRARWTICNVCETGFDPWSTVRWRKDGFDIVECPACRLVVRAELPRRDELPSIYHVGYFVRSEQDSAGQGYLDYVDGADLHRRTARARLRLLRRFVEPGRLFDVGAAAGFFFDEACRAGWDAQGIDISPEMVKWGASNLGVTLQQGDFTDLSIGGEAFEAVTMWDYIEHSLDPAADLAAAYRVLRPRGVVALSTGDMAHGSPGCPSRAGTS